MEKGITPVVAVIMLLLIVISLVGGMFVWMQRTMGGMQQQVGNQTQQQVERMQKTVTIVSIECGTPGTVYIRNTGSATIGSDELTLINKATGETTTAGDIDPDSVKTVSAFSTNGISDGQTITVSAPGNEDSRTAEC